MPDRSPAPTGRLADLTRAQPGAGRTAALAFRLAASPQIWRPLVRHQAGARAYAAIPALVDAEAWVITWAPGSGLDLHDHGGACGAMALVTGTLTERHGRRSVPGALRTRVLDAGGVVAFADDHVHEVRNRGVVPAVSVHVYAPGLETMRFYGDDPRDDRLVTWPPYEPTPSELIEARGRR